MSGSKLSSLAVSLVVLAASAAAPAAAQVREPRTQLSIGGMWAGGSALGSTDATETRNQIGGDRYTLFKTESDVQAAGGLEARLTYWVTRTVGAELGASWSRPRRVTRITNDAEGAPNQTARAGLTQYGLDGAVVVRLSTLAMAGGRLVPFGLAGVGYLRQLYEDNALVETGTAYHAGGGVLVWMQPPHAGWLKRVGARADARWTRHDGGIGFGEDGQRSFGSVSLGAVFQF